MATATGQRTSWLLKTVMILSATAQMAAYAIPTPLLSKMSVEFHGPMDDYMLKMVIGVAGPAMMIGSALGGLLTDMGGRRPTMIGAALLFGLAGAAPFALHSLPVILTTRFFAAAAAAAIATIGQAMVGDNFEESRRASWMGILGAVGMVSGFVLFPLTGVVGEIGWRWPFLIYLIGVLIAVVAWAGMPRDRPAQSKAPVAEAAEPKPAAKATAAANWPIRLFVLAFMTGPIFTLPSVYLSFYLPRFGYDGPSMTGGILALSSLVSAVFSASYGRARLRLSIRSIFAIGFAVAGLGLATLALAPNIWFVAAAMTMTGFAAGWVNANVFTAVIESVDEAHRGRALGITQASASLAPAVGVTALEPLVLRMGYSGVYILMGLLAAAVTLAVMVGGVARRRVAPAAAA